MSCACEVPDCHQLKLSQLFRPQCPRCGQECKRFRSDVEKLAEVEGLHVVHLYLGSGDALVAHKLRARLCVAAVEVRVDSGVEGAPQALDALLRGVGVLNCGECDVLLLAGLDRYAVSNSVQRDVGAARQLQEQVFSLKDARKSSISCCSVAHIVLVVVDIIPHVSGSPALRDDGVDGGVFEPHGSRWQKRIRLLGAKNGLTRKLTPLGVLAGRSAERVIVVGERCKQLGPEPFGCCAGGLTGVGEMGEPATDG
eukprot:6214813-Pleurochrysis_carterae.AAC.5